jgi:hypothetical protein
LGPYSLTYTQYRVFGEIHRRDGIAIRAFLLYHHGNVVFFQSLGSRDLRHLCSAPAQLRLTSAHPIYATRRSEDYCIVRRSVSKVVRIALLVSDNSTATVAIFTAVTHWNFSEWRHSPGQQLPAIPHYEVLLKPTFVRRLASKVVRIALLHFSAT